MLYSHRVTGMLTTVAANLGVPLYAEDCVENT